MCDCCHSDLVGSYGLQSPAIRRAEGSRGTPTKRAHLPEFVQRLRSKEVSLNDSVRLSASVMATPIASIVWEKDGVPLITDTVSSPYRSKVTTLGLCRNPVSCVIVIGDILLMS